MFPNGWSRPGGLGGQPMLDLLDRHGQPELRPPLWPVRGTVPGALFLALPPAHDAPHHGQPHHRSPYDDQDNQEPHRVRTRQAVPGLAVQAGQQRSPWTWTRRHGGPDLRPVHTRLPGAGRDHRAEPLCWWWLVARPGAAQPCHKLVLITSSRRVGDQRSGPDKLLIIGLG